MPSDLILPSNVILLAQESWKQEKRMLIPNRMSIFFFEPRYADRHEAESAEIG
jgi:hypothetical protein